MNTQAIEFALVVLATWRITSLFVLEDGPFDIFARLRYRIGVRYDEYSQPTIFKNTFAKGISCAWCFSIWVSFPAAFLSPYSANIRSFIINWLAISALVILFHELVDMLGRIARAR